MTPILKLFSRSCTHIVPVHTLAAARPECKKLHDMLELIEGSTWSKSFWFKVPHLKFSEPGHFVLHKLLGSTSGDVRRRTMQAEGRKA